jgi:hypothetical protein
MFQIMLLINARFFVNFSLMLNHKIEKKKLVLEKKKISNNYYNHNDFLYLDLLHGL